MKDSDLPVYLTIASYFPTPVSWRCAFVYDQVRAIQKTGKYRVVVVNTMYHEDYEYHGVEVWSLETVRKGTFLCPPLFEKINVGRMFAMLEAHGLDVGKVAVAHSHMVTMAMFAAALKKRNPKVVAICQSHDFDVYKALLSDRWSFMGVKKWMYFLYHRSLMEKMDVCVSISNRVTHELENFPHSVPCSYEPFRKVQRTLRWFRKGRLKNVFLLHNGVNLSVFSRSEKTGDSRRCAAIGNRTLSNHRFEIACIANFIDWKSHIVLFRALAAIKDKLGDWRLRCIGSGSELDECMRFASEHGLSGNIEILREVDHTQLPDFYRSLDLFVLPSYFEGFGCVFTEAWACGTPFITCEGQGMDDLILPEERSLWLCRQQDPDDLAEKILHYYRNRPDQHLASEIDIDVLVPRFLEKVDEIRLEMGGDN